MQTKRDNVANEEQEMEFSVTEDISDKLANPEETSKAKKKRKAHEKLVIWVVYLLQNTLKLAYCDGNYCALF